MCFDNHRIARGKSGGGISSRNREGERKVARPKDRNRAQRTQHGTQIGSR